jgi:hypothetical protein
MPDQERRPGGAELGWDREALAWIAEQQEATLKAVALVGVVGGLLKRQEAEKK